jgi:predicted nuclease of predicted toxin-antitoxin system
VRARLYLDEDVSSALAVMLRAAGYDVIHANEVGMSRAVDEDQFAKAAADDRAILTYNYRHFETIAENAARDRVRHAGIIISYHQYTGDQVGMLFRLVSRFLDDNDADYLKDTLRVLTR